MPASLAANVPTTVLSAVFSATLKVVVLTVGATVSRVKLLVPAALGELPSAALEMAERVISPSPNVLSSLAVKAGTLSALVPVAEVIVFSTFIPSAFAKVMVTLVPASAVT